MNYTSFACILPSGIKEPDGNKSNELNALRFYSATGRTDQPRKRS